MDFEYVYYYAITDEDTARFRQTYPDKSMEEIARMGVENNKMDFSKFLGPDEISQLIDLSEEDKSLCLTIEYKGKKSFLRTYGEQFIWPLDVYNMAGALQNLQQDNMPRFKFLASNHERSPFKMGEREYGGTFFAKWSRYSYVNCYLFCDTIKELIPSQVNEKDLLIIADPRSDLSQTTLDSVDTYIKSGKNLVILTEPNKQEVINPILRKIGLETVPGTLVLSTTDEVPDKIEGKVTEMAADLLSSVKAVKKKYGGIEHVYNYFIGLTGLSIIDHQFNWDTLGYIDNHDQKIWLERGEFVNDSAALVFNLATDIKCGDTILMATHLKRTINNREQKILVFSDADLLSNLRGANNHFGDFPYYFLNEEYPIVYLDKGRSIDSLLTVNKTKVKAFKFIISYVFTGLLLLTGIIILIRRKRK